MLSRQSLIKEIETLSPGFVEEVSRYVSYLKQMNAKKTDELILASEQSLAKDWLLPEEDAAWGNL